MARGKEKPKPSKKISPAKNKQVEEKIEEKTDEEEIETPAIDVKKVKLPIDIIEDDAVIDPIEKAADDDLVPEEEELEDELELDDEELDPFQDKWEQ